MTSVWCVCADKGKHTDQFVNGGYVGCGRGWPYLNGYAPLERHIDDFGITIHTKAQGVE